MHERQEMHKVGMDALALHPTHPLVATAGADRLVKLWPYQQQAYPEQTVLKICSEPDERWAVL